MTQTNKEITPEIVMERLKTVIDPELYVNIVDLGLIYEVKVETVNNKAFVKILMTLTTPGCPLGGMIEDLIRDALHSLPDFDADQDVEVKVVFDPPWTMDMMTDEVKMELGII